MISSTSCSPFFSPNQTRNLTVFCVMNTMATSIPTIPAPLYGKTALVTGGSRGIGRAIAVHLTRLGVSAVALTYASNKTSADSTLTAIREINPDVKAIAIHADILSPAFAPDLISATLSELDTTTLNILVNNAALADPAANQPISSATHEKFQQLMTGNAWAPTQLTLQALPHLPRGGRVINISSTASRQPNQEIATMYGASKAAFDSFTRSLAFNYSAEKGITINSVCVGPTVSYFTPFAFPHSTRFPRRVSTSVESMCLSSLC